MKKLRLLQFIILLSTLCMMLKSCSLSAVKNAIVNETVDEEPKVYANLDSASFSESADALNNPYTGWYSVYGFYIADDYDISYDTISKVQNRFAMIQFNINSYSESDISDIGLKKIDRVLDTFKSETNASIILRFVYDWDGNGRDTEPSSIDIIKSHMEQLSYVINEHADIIWLMQGIFVGDFAEMHDSAYMSDAGMTELMEKLCEVTDPSVFQSVRTPAHYRIINSTFETIDESSAYDGSIASRIGLFNDGLLGSENDFGTYGDGNLDDPQDGYDTKGTPEQEKAFQNKLCLYVPNGGEIGVESQYNDYENAVDIFKKTHITYLSASEAITGKWADYIIEDGVFNGKNGLYYITTHLGYRYWISDFSVENAKSGIDPDDDITLGISVENTGFANTYRPFIAELILTPLPDASGDVSGDASADASGDYGELSYTIDTDARFWYPSETTALSVKIPASDIKSGSYTVRIMLTDKTTGENILFANTGADKNGVKLGTLSISVR